MVNCTRLYNTLNVGLIRLSAVLSPNRSAEHGHNIAHVLSRREMSCWRLSKRAGPTPSPNIKPVLGPQPPAPELLPLSQRHFLGMMQRKALRLVVMDRSLFQLE